MRIFKTIIVLSGISLASGAAAADAPIAAIGRDAILNHAGVEDLGSLVGASIRDARGDSSGFIRRFNFVGDSIYAIVEREDGSHYAQSMMRLTYSDADSTSEEASSHFMRASKR